MAFVCTNSCERRDVVTAHWAWSPLSLPAPLQLAVGRALVGMVDALRRRVLDHVQSHLDAVDVSTFAGWQRRAGRLPQLFRRIEQVLRALGLSGAQQGAGESFRGKRDCSWVAGSAGCGEALGVQVERDLRVSALFGRKA